MTLPPPHVSGTLRCGASTILPPTHRCLGIDITGTITATAVLFCDEHGDLLSLKFIPLVVFLSTVSQAFWTMLSNGSADLYIVSFLQLASRNSSEAPAPMQSLRAVGF